MASRVLLLIFIPFIKHILKALLHKPKSFSAKSLDSLCGFKRVTKLAPALHVFVFTVWTNRLEKPREVADFLSEDALDLFTPERPLRGSLFLTRNLQKWLKTSVALAQTEIFIDLSLCLWLISLWFLGLSTSNRNWHKVQSLLFQHIWKNNFKKHSHGCVICGSKFNQTMFKFAFFWVLFWNFLQEVSRVVFRRVLQLKLWN